MNDSRRPRAARWTLSAVLLGAVWAGPSDGGSLRVRHLTPAEGLPNGRVWEVTQDRDGYVWIASSSGVTRTDGRRFRTLTIGDGLPHNTVLSLEADPAGGIWVGTARGLARVDEGEVVRTLGEEHGLASTVVRALLRSEDALWIGTEQGLHRLADGDGKAVQIPVGGEPPRIRDLAPAAGGGVWAATTRGLWRLRGDRLAPVDPQRGPPPTATAFGVLDQGIRLWVGTAEGLWLRDDSGDWSRFDEGDGLPVSGTNAIVAREDGTVWIGTWGGGLVSWTPAGGFEPFGRDRGFPLSFVTGAYVDAEDNLWATSHQSGVGVVVEHSFDVLGEPDGIPPLITRIEESEDGSVWLGSLGGLVVLPNGDERRSRVVALPDREVVDLVLDGESRPWIATRSGVAVVVGDRVRWFGLDELGGDRIEDLAPWRGHCFVMTDDSIVLLSPDGAEARLDASPVGGNILASRAHDDGTLWIASVRGLGKWRPGEPARLFDEDTGLPRAEVRSLWVDDGGVWAGTHSGLVRLGPDGAVRGVWNEEQGLPDRHVSQLFGLPNGDLWVGTERGAALLREGEVHAHPAGEGLIGSQVMMFAPDRKGRVWVGTDLGLNRCTAEDCEPFGRRLGMEQQPVYQVLRTGPESVWIVTSMGVYFWNGRDLAFYPCREDLGVRSITRLSALTDRQGRLWVGTDGGAIRFESPTERRERLLPLHLLDLQLDGRPIAQEALDRVLPPSTSTLGLEFVALSFREPQHVRYEVRWVDPEGRTKSWRTWERNFLLTGLRAGVHSVSIDARNVSGSRARAPISLDFRIAVPFWRRLPVQVATALLLILGIAAVVRLRTLALVRRQQRLEKLVRDRTAALDRANAKLARLATHDELTGLPNHRHFWERAREMRSRARRHGEGFALVILDIDDFKSINDRWGHLAGDEVLRRTGAVLAETLRDEDLLARYGGEEFAALLGGGSTESAVHVAERMRATLESTSVGAVGDDEIRVTGSFGVAVWNPEGDSLRGLFRRADVAVYRAKGEGKNRVVLQEAGDDDSVLDEVDLDEVGHRPAG